MSRVWFFISLSVLNFTALTLSVITHNNVVNTAGIIVHIVSIVTFVVIIPKMLTMLLIKDDKYFSKLSQTLSEMKHDDFTEFRKRRTIRGRGNHPEFPKKKYRGFEFYFMEYTKETTNHRYLLGVRMPNGNVYRVQHDCVADQYDFKLGFGLIEPMEYNNLTRMNKWMTPELAQFAKSLAGEKITNKTAIPHYSYDEKGIKQIYSAYEQKIFNLEQLHDLYFHPEKFHANKINEEYAGVPTVYLKASLKLPTNFPAE